MRLGVFDPIFGAMPLEEALDRVVSLGLGAIELGAGNYPGDARCRPADLLADHAALHRYAEAFASRELVISALSCHGNPVHPDPDRAHHHDAVFRDTVRLAARLGVDRVNVFSGCPGDGRGGRMPNWVTCLWPPEFAEILDWQWNDVVVPYWEEAAAFAQTQGVRLGFEMHPGFVVYNPKTLLRLRSAIGDTVGANFDPSHLFWQGIDPIAAIHELGAAIYHVHAKDTAINARNVSRNGVLDLEPATEVALRPWAFRSVGDGHDIGFWRQFVAALLLVGYDHVISIEHEDRLASVEAGLARAVETLRVAMLGEPVTPA